MRSCLERPVQETHVLHTLPELAALASVSRRFLELEVARGRLRAVRLSNRVRVRGADWDAYLTGNATKPE